MPASSTDEALTQEETPEKAIDIPKRSKKSSKKNKAAKQQKSEEEGEEVHDGAHIESTPPLPPAAEPPTAFAIPSPIPSPVLPVVLTPPDYKPNALPDPIPPPRTFAASPTTLIPSPSTVQSNGITSGLASPSAAYSSQDASPTSPPDGGICPAAPPPQLHVPESTPHHIYQTMQSRSRRPSSGSQASRLPRVHDAPPPHLPQRHFMRMADHDYGLAQEQSAAPGSAGCYCGFDTLDGSNCGAAPLANSVLLLGSEGALDVYRITRHRRDVVGRLEGLRGSVIDAKVLPWTDREDPLIALRPLIACTIHGPALEQGERMENDHADGSNASALNQLKAADITNYQTTVEVYSLSTCRRVATLYTGPSTPLEYQLTHPLFSPPPPVGDLSIAAEGIFVTVASGKSGEIYIFSPEPHCEAEGASAFRCIGKFWTSVKAHAPSARPSTNGISEPTIEPDSTIATPVLALSKRWLAIVPPALSSSQVSLEGTVQLSPRNPNPPGVSAYVSPPAPVQTCEVETPPGNGLFNRVTKQATQELRKGAQWVGEQGLNVLKTYWNRPPGVDSDMTALAPQKPIASDYHGAFPPTHAQKHEVIASHVEPSLVSVVDLQKLVDYEDGKLKNALSPLATFGLADGCTFLSFAPNGLALLSSNQMGDVSTVWDLMHVTDARAALAYSMTAGGNTPNATGLVRQMARFARMSPSSVIDVQWAAQGNRLAILTEKGTLHLHELPRSDLAPVSLQSPASRPISRSDLPSPSSSPQELPASGWMSNMRAGWQNVHGRLNAARSHSGSDGFGLPTLSTLGNASVAARYAGGRAVRNGFNIAAEGAHHIRHAEDNKIRLRPKRLNIRPACARWMSGKDCGLLATVVDGTLSVYAVRSNFHTQGKRTIISLDATKKATPDYSLKPIALNTLPPRVLGMLEPGGPHGACAKEGPHGFWTLHRPGPVRQTSTPGRKQFAAAVTQDKDTSPPYMPFHRNRQVGLFVYGEPKNVHHSGASMTSHLPAENEPWVFGLPLGRATKISCQQLGTADELDRDVANLGLEGVNIMGEMEGDFVNEMDRAVIGDGDFGGSAEAGQGHDNTRQ